jgi:hypothetical protein
MFYVPKHAQPKAPSTTRRRLTGLALAGVAAGVVPVATSAPASAAGASGGVWDRVAACESGGRWSINTGNGFHGGLQFHPQTWSGFGGGKYARYAHQATKAQQIEIAKKVLKVQGPGAWPVCSRRAGLTRANGLAVATSAGAPAASRSVARTATASSGRLAVDGVRGPQTNRAIERWIKTSAPNGHLNATEIKRLQRTVGVPASRANSNLRDRTFVRQLQAKVGATRDGIWGPRTTRALQRHLNSVNR